MHQIDVLIVGASIAGASLALRLSQADVKVALVDKATFPRRKPCGEGLSNIALGYLSDLGLGEKISALPQHPFYGYQIRLKNRSVDFARARGPLPEQRGVGIERFLLDNLLVESAVQNPSVCSFFGSKVHNINTSGDSYSVDIGQASIRSPFLVLADGANSLLASRLEVPCVKGKTPLWGWSQIWEGDYSQKLSAVAVFLQNAYEIYCTPIAENRLNVTALGVKGAISQFAKPSFREKEFAQAFDALAFSGRPAGKGLAIGPVGAVKRSCFCDNALLIGDACESLDPISGMGMTHALITSALAGEALISILKKGVSVQKAFDDYSKKREHAVRPYRGFTRLTKTLLRSFQHAGLIRMMAKTPLPGAVRDVLKAPSLKEPLSLSKTFVSLVGV